MSGTILCLNSGSSSLKFALYACGPDGAAEPDLLAHGKVEAIGLAPHLVVRDAGGALLAERRWSAQDKVTHETVLADLLDAVEAHARDQAGLELRAVGHRVVHGGADFAAPCRVDAAVLTRLDALCPLAPLHQPHNLAAIRAVAQVRPGLTQVACFDTAFHHDQPAVATRLALPRALAAEGVRRYGFHGLSYAYIADALRQCDPALATGRVVAAHLGNGASLCAMRGGRSIATTMGFTALDGLMMGTRCGAIDPGVVLYLLQHKGLDAAAIEHMLYQESGLLGVSGLSSDMRDLHASDDPRAGEAIALFAYRIVCETGALVATLGGLDGIVFTAGIGENDAVLRAKVCEGLGFMGLALDPAANAAHAPVISRADSRIVVRVIPTDEERMIARHTQAVLAQAREMA